MQNEDKTPEAEIRNSKSEIRSLRAPRGTEDVFPDEMRLARALEDTGRRLFELYGYGELRIPVFEHMPLFVHSIGETTDIVEKEMYTFEGSENESFALRPEGTAGVVRAYVQRGMDKLGGFSKFWYIGPMFRRERPQAGRMREFYQIGVEALGSQDASVDAETMELAMRYFREVGLEGCTLKVNSIGCLNCRATYREVLRKKLLPARGELCEDCRRRMDRNVFRVLDCKNETCRRIAAALPPMREHLDADCAGHFARVLEFLEAADVPRKVDDHLVRGFDYYTRTVWEIAHASLGARDAVCGGGRYDNLVADTGGTPTGAAGFSIGELPTLMALQRLKVKAPPVPTTRLCLVAIDDSCRKECFRLAAQLRGKGIVTDMDYQARSPKAQMRSANKSGAAFAGVIGPEELRRGTVTLKDMKTGQERSAQAAELAAILTGEKG
jgi:histidyl-tRNA synthetase